MRRTKLTVLKARTLSLTALNGSGKLRCFRKLNITVLVFVLGSCFFRVDNYVGSQVNIFVKRERENTHRARPPKERSGHLRGLIKVSLKDLVVILEI